MYHHVKELMYTVLVDEADPRFGNMLLEQFGGANGELGAAMQHSVQGLNCDDPERKDLLMDIASKSETVQGHVGLIEEGDEVIEEAKEKDGVAADLALIASAQKPSTTRFRPTARRAPWQVRSVSPRFRAIEQVARGGRDRRQPLGTGRP